MKRQLLGLIILMGLLAFNRNAEAQAYTVGGPVLKMNFVKNGTLIFIGGEGTRNYGPWYFGGAGYGLISGKACCWDDSLTGPLGFGYGGVLLGYQKRLSERWSFHVQGLFAFGGGGLDDEGYSAFIFEPEIGLSLKPTPVFALQFGLSYMQTVPTSSPDNVRPKLNSPGISIKFLFTSPHNHNHD